MRARAATYTPHASYEEALDLADTGDCELCDTAMFDAAVFHPDDAAGIDTLEYTPDGRPFAHTRCVDDELAKAGSEAWPDDPCELGALGASVSAVSLRVDDEWMRGTT